MITLNDVLKQAIAKGVYRDNKSGKYVVFVNFGSLYCEAKIFDDQGNFLKEDTLPIDHISERIRYELVKYHKLPLSLKQNSSGVTTNYPDPFKEKEIPS